MGIKLLNMVDPADEIDKTIQNKILLIQQQYKKINNPIRAVELTPELVYKYCASKGGDSTIP